MAMTLSQSRRAQSQPIETRTLQQFAWVLGAGLILLFSIIRPLLKMILDGHAFEWVVWPGIIFGVLALVSLVAPRLLNPLYHLWIKIGHVLGAINSRIILGIMFYGLIMPVGLVMRLSGRDQLPKHPDPAVSTYRIASKQRDPKHLEKPY